MKFGRRTRPHTGPPAEPDLDGAIDAMTAEELRSFVRGALEGLDDAPRAALMDSLLARAAKGRSGWRPSGPSRRLVGEVEHFAEAARRVGYAEPDEVSGYLRQGTKAFLAGDQATARAVFEALLPPIADGEIDLGQHEMVDEVLTVNERECAAQYLVSVYLTTPVEERAEALCEALERVQAVASLWRPIEEMKRVATGPLPELDTFLPHWVRHLEREPPSDDDWEGDRERWLREAVFRTQGVDGLERIARKTKRPQALQAWCEALIERRDWAKVLRAYDDATKLAGKSRWRGDFLDGAALAAQQLGHSDAAKRLEAAWLGAPTLVRLLRWLGADGATAATLGKKAKKAIMRCPTTAGRQLALLHVLTGDLHAAAKLLAKAPGLGWSSEGHPGHVLFPAFAGLLAEGMRARLSAGLLESLQETWLDPSDIFGGPGSEVKPTLRAPSIFELIANVRPALRIDSVSRDAMLHAMRVAAERRVKGILDHKRRRHYGHAATLAACCLELAPVVGKQKAFSDWIDDLRNKHSRFHAFQQELEHALARLRPSDASGRKA